MRRSMLITAATGASLVAGCHSVDPPYSTTQYAVAANDWQGDFLRVTPETPLDYRLSDGRLTYYLSTSFPDCCTNAIRLFRLSDGMEVSGSMQDQRLTLDGRELPQDRPYEVYPSFVAREDLPSGWYIAGFDARAYASQGPAFPFMSAPALDGVAYARLRIGDGVDWVRTHANVRDGSVDVGLMLSSRVPTAELESSVVEVRRAGERVDCTRASTGEDPDHYIVVVCPGLQQGDTIEVRLVSDRVGHPTGEMQTQTILIDVGHPEHEVAPELGLDVLRAAYGIGGGGA
ncbi:MAG: hypothetical protein U0353_20640 [Sandaracinus sp.]